MPLGTLLLVHRKQASDQWLREGIAQLHRNYVQHGLSELTLNVPFDRPMNYVLQKKDFSKTCAWVAAILRHDNQRVDDLGDFVLWEWQDADDDQDADDEPRVRKLEVDMTSLVGHDHSIGCCENVLPDYVHGSEIKSRREEPRLWLYGYYFKQGWNERPENGNEAGLALGNL